MFYFMLTDTSTLDTLSTDERKRVLGLSLKLSRISNPINKTKRFISLIFYCIAPALFFSFLMGSLASFSIVSTFIFVYSMYICDQDSDVAKSFFEQAKISVLSKT